jgi:hypothetical protein
MSNLNEMTDLFEAFESMGLSVDTSEKIKTMLEESQKESYQSGYENGKKVVMEAAEDYQMILKEAADAYAEEIFEAKDSEIELIKEAAEAYTQNYEQTIKEAADAYATKAVDTFITEQQENFVHADAFKRMSDAFSMMKEAFEMNGFVLQNNKKELALKEALDEVTAQYDEIFEQLTESRSELESFSQAVLAERAFSDLSDVQKDKANKILENLVFNSTEDYEKGLASIVESVSKKTDKVESLTENIEKAPTNRINMDFRGLL